MIGRLTIDVEYEPPTSLKDAKKVVMDLLRTDLPLEAGCKPKRCEVQALDATLLPRITPIGPLAWSIKAPGKLHLVIAPRGSREIQLFCKETAGKGHGR